MSPKADQIMKAKMASVCEEEMCNDSGTIDRPTSLQEAKEKYVETDQFEYDIADFEEDVRWILEQEEEDQLGYWQKVDQLSNDSTEQQIGPLGQFMSAFMSAMDDVMQGTADMVQQTYDVTESGVNVTVDLTGEGLGQIATAMGMERKAGESDEELRSRVRNAVASDNSRTSPLKLDPEMTIVHTSREMCWNDNRPDSILYVVQTGIPIGTPKVEKLCVGEELTVYLDGSIYEDGRVVSMNQIDGYVECEMEFGTRKANSPKYDTYSPGLEA